MVNQKFLFNKAGLIVTLSCLGLANASKNDSKTQNKNDKTQDKSTFSPMNSPECVASKNSIANFIKNSNNGKPLITLCLGSRILMEMIEAMLGFGEVAARLQELMPNVQKKIAEAGNQQDKSKLESDPDVKEAMELSIKGKKLYKQRDEIMEAALELFKSIIFGLNKNSLILVQGAELISAEDAPDDNHVLLDAQKLYKFCLMESHARSTRVIGDDKNPPKTESKDNATQLKSSTQSKSTTQLKSETQFKSGPAKKE